jgi:hypothetical protein
MSLLRPVSGSITVSSPTSGRSISPGIGDLDRDHLVAHGEPAQFLGPRALIEEVGDDHDEGPPAQSMVQSMDCMSESARGFTLAGSGVDNKVRSRPSRWIRPDRAG